MSEEDQRMRELWRQLFAKANSHGVEVQFVRPLAPNGKRWRDYTWLDIVSAETMLIHFNEQD